MKTRILKFSITDADGVLLDTISFRANVDVQFFGVRPVRADEAAHDCLLIMNVGQFKSSKRP